MRTSSALLAAIFFSWTPALACQAPTSAPDFEVVGPSFLAIQTADVETAADWYASVLGLSEVNRIDAEDGRFSIRILSNDGLSVELIQMRGSEAPHDRHLGLFKAGFYVDDIDAAHAWLERREVDVDPRIFEDGALQARSFLFRDIDGNRLQVFERCREACDASAARESSARRTP